MREWGRIGPVMVWRWPVSQNSNVPFMATNWGWVYAHDRYHQYIGEGAVYPMTMIWARAPEYFKGS